jgi:tetratricopeptide (TPR) repeat protein
VLELLPYFWPLLLQYGGGVPVAIGEGLATQGIIAFMGKVFQRDPLPGLQQKARKALESRIHNKKQRRKLRASLARIFAGRELVTRDEWCAMLRGEGFPEDLAGTTYDEIEREFNALLQEAVRREPALFRETAYHGLVKLGVAQRELEGLLRAATSRILSAVYESRDLSREDHLRAERKLEELAAQITELSASASVPHQIPPAPADFTGRDRELDDLLNALGQQGAVIAGLRGMGGIGKTALACKLAARLADRYPDGQIYLDLRGTTDPLTPLDAMAHVIRSYRPQAALPESEAEVSGWYRTLLHSKRVLLLMDNAADAAQVAPLLPPDGCMLLVTSRQHFALPGLLSRNLDVLPKEDAQALVLKLAPQAGSWAAEIAELCACLPLALRAAGSLLAVAPDLGPGDYVAALRDERTRLKTIGREGVELDVEASLNLSYTKLSPESARVLRRLAVFVAPFRADSEEAVCEDENHAHLSNLVRRSFVEWDGTGRRYHLHDLVRLFADSRLEGGERRAAEQRHAEHYDAVLHALAVFHLRGGEDQAGVGRLFNSERRNIEAGQTWAAAHADENDSAAALSMSYANAAAHVLRLWLHPRQHLGWLRASFRTAQRLKDRRAEGATLYNLGVTYLSLGESPHAVQALEEALAIARELEDEHGQMAALSGLGNACVRLGENRRAIGYYEQALDFSRRFGDRRTEGTILGNLGLAYDGVGDKQRAFDLHRENLSIARELGDLQAEGNALGNLANSYREAGKISQAIELYDQQLVVVRMIGDRLTENIALGNLGLAYAALGQDKRAIELFERQFAIAREIGDQRGEGISLYNTSLALGRLGDLSGAIVGAESAASILEQIHDPRAMEIRTKVAEWRQQGEARK